MKKMAKSLGKLVMAKHRSRKKGTSLAVKVSVTFLAVKLIFRLLFALFFVFPYSFTKNGNGWSLKAILYGADYTKKYSEKTNRTNKKLSIYPIGIVRDQFKTAKNLILRK